MKRGHRGLRVWQAAIALVADVYRVTESFPRAETFGLAAQMRRAAVSVPANIAEGAARRGPRELARFLNIASGSLAELDALVEVARTLGFMADTAQLQARIDEVSALTLALQKSIRDKAEEVD